MDPASGIIPKKVCAEAIEKLRPTLTREAKLARLNTSTRRLIAGVKRSMDHQPESFDAFMEELLSGDELKDAPA